MAKSGPSYLKDMDEKFCQCSICLQQYREPKVLPCLHRYCSDCLKQLIERNQGVTAVNCPECREEFQIPREGVDGFKADFYMNSIIEYIQIQKLLEQEQQQECYGCSKKLSVTAFCFSCNGFLCKECYKFHMTNKSLEDHKQHVVSLEDLKSKHMTLEKLADLKEAPRCQSHLKDLCLLCCKTCNDLPICVACVHGRHKNHNINDVEIIANEGREKLTKDLEDLSQNKERMSKDMKKEFPELETLSRIEVSPEIIEDEVSPVNVEGIQKNNWIITGITGCDDGSIVITGYASQGYQSHITVINMKGKEMHQKKLKCTDKYPYRFCAFLSEFKVVTVCESNEIGVFDMRNYSYIKKNINDVISSWPVDRTVTCVTTDLVNNHILVGRVGSRDVYVFDDQLNYHHTLKLPEMIKYPIDINFNKGNLLVCDSKNKGAYVVSMDGLEGKVIHEFTKPDFEGDDWKPINVCTDSNGLIYILWMKGFKFTAGRRVVTKYTQDGRQLLTAKQIDAKEARCISTVMTGMTEKLLVATWETGKLHIYSI